MNLVEGHLPLAAPADMPVLDADPYAVDSLIDPQGWYAELREAGPFVYLPRYAALACGRYAATREVFSDHARFVSSRGVGLADFHHDEPWRPPSLVLEVDPPAHTRTRTVLMRVLSPRRVARLVDTMQQAANELVDALIERSRFDGVADCGEVFPTTVFPRAVGLRESDRRRLIDYGAMVFNALGPDNALRRDALASAGDIVPRITARCARDALLPDGLGADIYASADSGELIGDEAGMLVGWISERECLQAALQVVYHNQRVATVKDLMQSEVLTVSLESDVLSLAQQMLNAKPKIYPVVDTDNKVLGVISRRHILNMLDDKLAELSRKAS